MSEYTWRELERADKYTEAAHAIDMEYRAEQIAREARKRLARMEHIIDGLGDVKGEIVRCRDCKEYIEFKDYATCGYFGGDYAEIEPDGFCAWGEKAVNE